MIPIRFFYNNPSLELIVLHLMMFETHVSFIGMFILFVEAHMPYFCLNKISQNINLIVNSYYEKQHLFIGTKCTTIYWLR